MAELASWRWLWWVCALLEERIAFISVSAEHLGVDMLRAELCAMIPTSSPNNAVRRSSSETLRESI